MTDKHEKRKDKRKYCNLYVKSTIYGKSLIFYLNNKYFTLLENGSVYGTGNNSNNHRWWPWIDSKIAKRSIGFLGNKDIGYSDNGWIGQEAYS